MGRAFQFMVIRNDGHCCGVDYIHRLHPCEYMSKTEWILDPAHSEVGFQVRHMGITNVKGFFETFTGSLTAPSSDFRDSKVMFEAEVAHGVDHYRKHAAPARWGIQHHGSGRCGVEGPGYGSFAHCTTQIS